MRALRSFGYGVFFLMQNVALDHAWRTKNWQKDQKNCYKKWNCTKNDGSLIE